MRRGETLLKIPLHSVVFVDWFVVMCLSGGGRQNSGKDSRFRSGGARRQALRQSCSRGLYKHLQHAPGNFSFKRRDGPAACGGRTCATGRPSEVAPGNRQTGRGGALLRNGSGPYRSWWAHRDMGTRCPLKKRQTGVAVRQFCGTGKDEKGPEVPVMHGLRHDMEYGPV